jgi:hypothetical protein
MDSKTKKRLHKNKMIEKVKLKSKRSEHARRTVTQRAASSERTCPMKLVVFCTMIIIGISPRKVHFLTGFIHPLILQQNYVQRKTCPLRT